MIRNKMMAAVAALALSATLLAGCASTGNTSSSASGSSASTATSEATSSSSMATADSASSATADSAPMAATGYDSEKMKTVLNEFVSYEADTAGGSLKAAMAAADLTKYVAESGADATDKMTADVQSWKDALTDEQKTVLKMNWPMIRDTAKSLAEDAAGQKDLLESAGVTTDFSKMDMSKVTAAVTSLDSVLGAA